MEDRENKNSCIYCKGEILASDAYSIRKMGDRTIKWHYLCYTKEAIELVPLSVKEQEFLINLVLRYYPNPDGLALLALRGLGYGL